MHILALELSITPIRRITRVLVIRSLVVDIDGILIHLSGFFHQFECNQDWGNGRLVSIEKVKNAACKFLQGDVFIVKLFLRIKMPENEIFEVTSNETSATCTVHKELSSHPQLDPIA